MTASKPRRTHVQEAPLLVQLLLCGCTFFGERTLQSCSSPSPGSTMNFATATGFVASSRLRRCVLGSSHKCDFPSEGQAAPSVAIFQNTDHLGMPKSSVIQSKSLSTFGGRRQSVLRSATENPMDGASELTSTLAMLDRQWKIQKRPGGSEGFEWERMYLDSEKKEDSEKASPTDEEDKSIFGEDDDAENESRDYVYILEPPPSVSPSSVIVFLGGAVLGQFPHIAYSELLKRVSRRLNAAVIAVPYYTGLDHLKISQKSAELLRRAIIKCEDERGYFENLPKFAVGHSLGAKLHTLISAATGIGGDFSGIGYLSYNNFGFVDTIRMARQFASQLRSGDGTFASRMKDDDDDDDDENPFRGPEENVVDTLLDFAQQAIGMVGLEFSPSPTDTSRIIERKFERELQSKTRLFVFDDDDLDSTPSFVESCRVAVGGEEEPPVTISALPGTHLTPVFIQFGLEELPSEVRSAASEMMGGFRGGSFGTEEELDALVQEMCNWILGKPPKQRSSDKLKEAMGASGPKRLPGDILDAEPIE